jgi:hypothetical protein
MLLTLATRGWSASRIAKATSALSTSSVILPNSWIDFAADMALSSQGPEHPIGPIEKLLVALRTARACSSAFCAAGGTELITSDMSLLRESEKPWVTSVTGRQPLRPLPGKYRVVITTVNGKGGQQQKTE